MNMCGHYSVEVNIQLVPVINYAPCHVGILGGGGVEVQFHTFLASPLDAS